MKTFNYLTLITLPYLTSVVKADHGYIFTDSSNKWSSISGSTLLQFPGSKSAIPDFKKFNASATTVAQVLPRFDASLDIIDLVDSIISASYNGIVLEIPDNFVIKNNDCAGKRDYKNLQCLFWILTVCSPPSGDAMYYEKEVFVRNCRPLLKDFPDSYRPYATDAVNRVAAITSPEPSVWTRFIRNTIAKNHVEFSLGVVRRLTKNQKHFKSDEEFLFFLLMERMISRYSAVSDFVLPNFSDVLIRFSYYTYTGVSNLSAPQLNQYLEYNRLIRQLSKVKRSLDKRQQSSLLGLALDTKTMIELCPL